MHTTNEILIALGRIEGELIAIRRLSDRVNALEIWQAWLKGGWAAIVAAYAYLYRHAKSLILLLTVPPFLSVREVPL